MSEPRFHDPLAALAHVEAVLWPNGPVCPNCGAMDRIYDLKGKSTKPGVRKCGHCAKLFTVTVGTIMESSHLPLNKWLQAIQYGHRSNSLTENLRPPAWLVKYIIAFYFLPMMFGLADPAELDTP